MSINTKYIIGNICGLETAVVFSELLKHSDVARGAFGSAGCVSAGFCYVNPNGRITVYGKSDSLNLSSRAEVDNLVIEQTLGITVENEKRLT